jgi:N-acetylmuramoyl-L-alanine amidase
MPATAIQAALVDACGMADRKVRETQKYFVLRHTKALAMVIEPGFMSNPGELLMLRDAEYQGKIVDAIARGVQKYSVSR